MKLLWWWQAWTDYGNWQAEPATLRRINALLEDIRRNSYRGIGKPEALRGDLSGFWSRRIDQEHRLVYRVRGDTVEILSCRYHYRR